MNLPKNCNVCSERESRMVITVPPLLDFLHYCGLKNRMIETENTRPDWCPMDDEKDDNTSTSD